MARLKRGDAIASAGLQEFCSYTDTKVLQQPTAVWRRGITERMTHLKASYRQKLLFKDRLACFVVFHSQIVAKQSKRLSEHLLGCPLHPSLLSFYNSTVCVGSVTASGPKMCSLTTTFSNRWRVKFVPVQHSLYLYLEITNTVFLSSSSLTHLYLSAQIWGRQVSKYDSVIKKFFLSVPAAL